MAPVAAKKPREMLHIPDKLFDAIKETDRTPHVCSICPHQPLLARCPAIRSSLWHSLFTHTKPKAGAYGW